MTTLILSLTALTAITVALTTWFCLRTFKFILSQRREDFDSTCSHYRHLLEQAPSRETIERRMADLVTANNTNTLALEKAERTLAQLTIRMVGQVDRTRERRNTQVGEESPPPRSERIAGSTIFLPTTEDAAGNEGFVTESGKPETPPATPRALARTEPT